MSTTEEQLNQDAVPEDLAVKRAALEADIAKSAKRVMNHMNADHEDSLIAYVLALATGIEGAVDDGTSSLNSILTGEFIITSAQLTTVDVHGFLLEVKAKKNSLDSEKEEVVVLSNVRVPYDKPIESARDLHTTAVRMHRVAYDKLGVLFKIKKGYYKQVMKFVAFKSYKVIQKSTPMVAVGTATLIAATAAAGYLLRQKSSSSSMAK